MIDENENEKSSLDLDPELREIRIIRLISGEELIGEATPFIDDDGTEKVVVERPAVIVIQRPTTAQDRVGIGLVGWLPYSTVEKEGVLFDKQHVVFITSPEEGLLKSYKERFTVPGLVLPQTDLLTSSAKSGLILK
jgi:hypothetical protein